MNKGKKASCELKKKGRVYLVASSQVHLNLQILMKVIRPMFVVLIGSLMDVIWIPNMAWRQVRLGTMTDNYEL